MPGSTTADPEHPQTMPFKAEYARSGRSHCKGCSELIEENELRIATQVKSRLYEGMQQNWQHFDCFFKRNRPTNTGDIENFENLRWDDQKRIEDKFNELHSREMSPERHMLVSDFKVEYPKSARSMCPVCENYISKNVPRIGMEDYESENSRRFGPHYKWHHVDCFVKARDNLGYTASGEELPGFNELESEDQEEIRNKLPVQEGHVPEKKIKVPVTEEGEQMEEESGSSEQEEQMEVEDTQKEDTRKKGRRSRATPASVKRGGRARAKEEDAQRQMLEEHAVRGRKGQTMKKEEPKGKAGRLASKGPSKKATPAKKGRQSRGGASNEKRVRRDQEKAVAEQQADEEMRLEKVRKEDEEAEAKTVRKPARGRAAAGTANGGRGKRGKQVEVEKESPPAKKMKLEEKAPPLKKYAGGRTRRGSKATTEAA